MKLSKKAEQSLKTHGLYQCSKPAVPYRAFQLDPLATIYYNKLYLMGFIRSLNEGQRIIRTEDGTVRCTISGAGWVHAKALTETEAVWAAEDAEGAVARIYMTGIEQPVALLVRGDSPDAHKCIDFTSHYSDALGFYVRKEE